MFQILDPRNFTHDPSLSLPLSFGLGAAWGCLAGAVGGSPVIPCGIVSGIASLANYVLSKLVNDLVATHDLSWRTFTLLLVAKDILIVSALAVSFAALNIINPESFTFPFAIAPYIHSTSMIISAYFNMDDRLKSLSVNSPINVF